MAETTPTTMTPLTTFVVRHRRWVVGFWLIMLERGAGKVSQRLTVDFSLPGQPGYDHFPYHPDMPGIVSRAEILAGTGKNKSSLRTGEPLPPTR